MKFRIDDKICMTAEGKTYGYSIEVVDDFIDYTLDIKDVTKILNIGTDSCLDMVEERGAIAGVSTGRIYFHDIEDAEEFKRYLEEHLKG